MRKLSIKNRSLGTGFPPYLVAELSANHGQSFDRAKAIIREMAEAGADAIKVQTFTPDTLSVDCKNQLFFLKQGLWEGQYQYDLYKKGYMPWEWHQPLAEYANELGVDFFSTPFDESAVDFLEHSIDPPCYKISSFEVTHHPLLKQVARTGKPVIMSTGMASEGEIAEAVQVLRQSGCESLVLLKCITMYPADPKDFHLNSIKTLAEKFDCLVGLSDHSLGNEICLGAVALGACMIEKHVVLSHDEWAVDGAFSLDPKEFRNMAKSIKILHTALGQSVIAPSMQEKQEKRFRRTLFVTQPIRAGEALTPENIRVVRMASGLEPKYWDEVLGQQAVRDLKPGDPLSWECIEENTSACVST